jgi:hypothetical protein
MTLDIYIKKLVFNVDAVAVWCYLLFLLLHDVSIFLFKLPLNECTLSQGGWLRLTTADDLSIFGMSLNSKERRSNDGKRT